MKVDQKNVSVKPMYYSVQEVSVYTGVSERKIRDCIASPLNSLPHYRIGESGRIIRVHKDELDLWLKGFKVESGSLDIDGLIEELI